MTEITWWSQQFAPEGSVAGDGIVKQLGRPSLDPLTILVREAAQNSWDARAEVGIVEFQINIRRLGSAVSMWRKLLLPGPHVNAHVPLVEVLSEDSIMLVVSDRNTVGLGGPLRAGTRPADDEKPDFVQFMRNVGEPRDHEHGGGTYGFGKGIFYRLSKASAILVDTRATGVGPSRRLMGAALGDTYYVADQRYTGRHWWGMVRDNVPDPVIEDLAEGIADELGLPGFSDGRTGTDIVVIAADLGSVDTTPDGPERTIDQAADYLASSMLWHLWPKFLPDEQGRHMTFAVKVDGRDIAMPSPAQVDDLTPFVEALADIRAGEGAPYARTVEPKNVGLFSLKLWPADARAENSPHNVACPFSGPLHHVARMRTPELIVDYQAGVPHPDARLSYGAVFRASREADAAFALAEPPTHDSWIAKGLTGSAKGVVQRLQSFIARQIEQSLNTYHADRTGVGAGLGDLSARLGTLIPPSAVVSANGRAAASSQSNSEVRGDGEGRVRPGRRPPWKPRLSEEPRLQILEGEPRVVARVHVPAAGHPRTAQARVDVVVEGGGTEADPPEGAVIPRIIEWRAVTGGDVAVGDVLSLPAGEACDWWLHASYVDDAVVRLKVSAGSRHGQ